MLRVSWEGEQKTDLHSTIHSMEVLPSSSPWILKLPSFNNVLLQSSIKEIQKLQRRFGLWNMF